MNISENIQWITHAPGQWKLYRNRSYLARIQTADPSRIYCDGGEPGIVYNCLEQSYERVAENGYIVTGLMGEMWPIGRKVLPKYDIDPNAITDEPTPVFTRETDTVYAGIRIPVGTRFTLETDYGEKVWLKGNAAGIPHGTGDYVLVCTRTENGVIVPDFGDCGRIINGSIFGRLYQPYHKEKGSKL